MKYSLSLLFALGCCMMMACSEIESVEKNDSGTTMLHSSARYSNSRGISTYEVNPSIVGYFQHYWQNQEPRLITKEQAANSCGATSYMMVANCFARSKGLVYGVNKEKQKKIVDQVGAPTDLGRLRDYVTLYDSGFLTKSLTNAVSDREQAKNIMENTLMADGFLIVGLNAYIIGASNLVHTNPYYSTSASVNPDLDGPMSAQKYITGESKGTKSGSYSVGQHLVVIMAIAKNNSTGNGLVTYIDPISQTRTTSNRKYVTYARLLDAMRANSGGKYQFLSIYRK